ncbi:MAG: hypothetical protein IPP40_07875 [bacterium]|nr:hypothetical protein [bacterium]
MKTQMRMFVGLGALICVAIILTASTVISGNTNGKTALAATAASVQQVSNGSSAPEAKPSSDVTVSADLAVSTIIAKRTEIQDLYNEFRAAKNKGTTPSHDLYSQRQQLSPPAEHRGRLDQGGEDCATATLFTTVPYSDFGTTAGYNDDTPECDGSGTGPDVAYVYTPPVTSDFHISLCGSSYDTKIAVYESSCAGTPIACNDDGDCWPGSDLPRVTLTAGTTYYFVIDGYDGAFGDYSFFIEELAPPPTGDNCEDPIIIASLPYSVQNETNCLYLNDYTSSTCLSTQDEGPDAIYQFTLNTATSVEIILSAHLAEPPQESWVMPGILLTDHCPPDWSCIASASAWTIDESIPLVLACNLLQPGTYYVMVDNGTWFHPCYTYDLLIQPCGPCDITSQPGDVAEVAETFPLPGTFSINDPNGGCNNDTPFEAQFQTVSNGQTVFGRTFAYSDSITGTLMADTDWYHLVLNSPATLMCTYIGETSLQVALLEPPCPSMILINGIQTTPCGSRSLSTTCLDPGEYYVRVRRGGAMSGPDAVPFDYRVSFALTPCQLPTGRCCYAGTCTMNTHPECEILDGYWDGSLTCNDACPDYPPNDHCRNAGIPAPLPATFTGDNTNATNDCPQEGDPQVWHVFTTTETQDIQIDYCGTQNFHSFNPWIYDGCPCGDRIMLEAVDWGYCFPTTAMTGLWRNVPAGTWYISVTMYDPNSIGPYTIHVNAVSNQPPANNECATAEPITVVPNGQVTVSGTTMNATPSCTNGCDEGGFTYNSSGNDVFYSIHLNGARKIAMALGTSDMHISVYQGLGVCCTDPALLCNDDDANFQPLPTWDVPEQHPGESRSYVAAELEAGTYLIRVAKYGAQAGAYTLTVYDNGSLHCTPPDAPTDLTANIDGNNIELRWSTDVESATRGTYRIWSNTEFVPFDDPSWMIVADNIAPVVDVNHLYYTGPYSGNNKVFYVVTGQCTETP